MDLLTDSYKLHLMLDQTAGGPQMVCQLTSTNPETDVAGCLVELTHNNKKLESVFTGENGEFLLSAVPRDFELKIHGFPESFIVSMI